MSRACACGSKADLVDAGGNVGIMCRGCFNVWDRAQEQRELELAGWEVYLGGDKVLEPISAAEAPAAPKRDRSKPPATSRPLLHVTRRPGEPMHVARARDRLAAHGIYVEAA